MTKTYADFGATYGAHADKTYGTLFDPDLPPTEGLVALLARVSRLDIYAEPNNTSVMAKVTTPTVGWTLN